MADPAQPRTPAAVPTRTAAFFDLDKTIIARSSTLAFSRSFYQGGLINRRAVLRSAYAQFVYLVGGADHDQMERMRAYLSSMATGWDVEQVKVIVAETLHQLIDPLIYEEAATLIEEHHLAGRDVVIVSTSGAEVVEPIGQMLGADHVIATRMVVEDGKYSGAIEYYAYAETKAAAIRELAGTEGYDLSRSYAYSDSVTDLPMLEAVGHPYAVNPDRGLRKEAAVAGLADARVHPPGEAAGSLRRRQPAATEHAGCRRDERRRRDRGRRVVRRAAQGRGPSTTAACRSRDTPRWPGRQVKKGCGPFPRRPSVR